MPAWGLCHAAVHDQGTLLYIRQGPSQLSYLKRYTQHIRAPALSMSLLPAVHLGCLVFGFQHATLAMKAWIC